uniref:Ovule protein n=1 Tax=Heterorhabditis bacteriophora TaxID=37862 RepID=A0A1I7WT20_HETBA
MSMRYSCNYNKICQSNSRYIRWVSCIYSIITLNLFTKYFKVFIPNSRSASFVTCCVVLWFHSAFSVLHAMTIPSVFVVIVTPPRTSCRCVFSLLCTLFLSMPVCKLKHTKGLINDIYIYKP